MNIEASIRLKNSSGIDKHLQKQIESEKTRWVDILERMMSIVFLLASNNLSSPGSETLYTPNNDCTPDVSHVQQLSVTFRFVDTNKDVEVHECFVAYKPVSDSSGVGLTGIFLVRDALLYIYEETNDSVAASEALSLIHYRKQFEFIVTMVAWYDILFQVNTVSRAMQSESMDLPNISQWLKNCSEFVKQYQASSSALITAKEIASQAEIDPIFKAAISRRKKQLFDSDHYEAVDETPFDPEKLFKMNVFYPMIDTIENALVTRFKQLSIFNDTWSFLYNMKIIPERTILEKVCADLQISLTDGEKCDVSGCQFVEEFMSLNPSSISRATQFSNLKKE
ncbi:hypothetical protein EVAR_10273_1 [Eumeta japonica]|uniref:Uncharacterized protein n=1 Tax=Eumeta variegata TaxID=151549 RepID=A0A4C1TEI4_EUMVA|nr:hypothetical protein EVAR_10273_1 [Eumeta japonica]